MNVPGKGFGHADPEWREYLESLPTSDLEALRRAEVLRCSADPYEATTELIDLILRARREEER